MQRGTAEKQEKEDGTETGDKRMGSEHGKIRGEQKPGEKNVADVQVGCRQWKSTGAGWYEIAQHSLLSSN